MRTLYQQATLLLICSAFLLVGCGKEESKEATRSEKKSKPADSQEDADEPGSGDGLWARGASLGKQLVEKGHDSVQSATNTVTESFASGRSWTEDSLSDLAEASRSLVKASGEKLDVARDGVNKALRTIVSASIPDSDKIKRIVILMIPVIGPSHRYREARALYAEGKSETNAAKVARARREALMACAEAGLDIGTLGLLGGGVDLLTTSADRILSLLKVGRTVNILTGSDSDVLTGYLDGLLQNEQIRNAVDTALAPR